MGLRARISDDKSLTKSLTGVLSSLKYLNYTT